MRPRYAGAMNQMVRAELLAERRRLERFPAEDLDVTLRPHGRWRRLRVPALDFNRFGIALLVPRILAKHSEIHMRLKLGERCLQDVIGIVHNCLEHGDGYRCGIQFRTDSAHQFDPVIVESELLAFEMALQD